MKILISKLAHDKVMHWVHKADIEVSGFGIVQYDKASANFKVVDAFMLEQTGGAAHTDINGQSLAKLMYKTKDLEGSLRWWWHSHVNMATFWSGTDLSTIKELGGNGWITASVFNKKGDIKSAVCWKTASELGASLSINDDIPTEIEKHIDADAVKLWDKEFNDNLKKAVVVPVQSRFGGGYAGEYYDNWESYQYNKYEKPGKDDPAPENTIKKITGNNLTKEQKKNKKEYFRHGYFGYGAVLESKILQMSPDAYVNKLLFGDEKDYEQIEAALAMAEHTGVLV